MTPSPDRLGLIDEASARFDRARETLQRIPAEGEDVSTVGGITHERDTLAARLRSFRADVAAVGDRSE